MPDLDFHIDEVAVAPRSASPQLVFELAVTNAPPEERIHTVMLQCQILFEAPRRSYNVREKEKLSDLFGEPERWGQTLRSTTWTQTDISISGFSGSTTVNLPVPCTLDLTVASTKYFYALEEGEIPLTFLFSGTAFYAGAGGNLQVHHIPHSTECSYQMPVQRWKDMMEHHYGNTAWLTLQRDLFDRLYAYKRRHGLATMGEAVERLLARQERRPQELQPESDGVTP